MATKVLIATTCRWFSAARLALAFHRCGCAVEGVCPPGHPLGVTRVLDGNYPYRALRPLSSLRAAILKSSATLIAPCDELAVLQLHRLYKVESNSDSEASRTICERIRFSLGDPAGYAITESRDNFMAMVHEEGICTPETKTIGSVEEVEPWVTRHGLPAVLKADGTSGGEGVKIVRTLDEARRAFRTLSAPLTTMVVWKRALLDRDWNGVPPWLGQQKRSVSIQSFVTGPDANVAAAAWQGRLLAATSVEVLETWRPKGPATLVRLIRDEEMLEAVEKILRRLKFSGLCGFDFMIDKATGRPVLIEMNPRATQTCPLPVGRERDPVGAICAAATGERTRCEPLDLRSDVIALFPAAWQGNTASETFQSAYHDIPWEEPDLVRRGMHEIRHRPREKWATLFAKLGLHEQ